MQLIHLLRKPSNLTLLWDMDVNSMLPLPGFVLTSGPKAVNA